MAISEEEREYVKSQYESSGHNARLTSERFEEFFGYKISPATVKNVWKAEDKKPNPQGGPRNGERKADRRYATGEIKTKRGVNPKQVDLSIKVKLADILD